jgi:hypothetical protein
MRDFINERPSHLIIPCFTRLASRLGSGSQFLLVVSDQETQCGGIDP